MRPLNLNASDYTRLQTDSTISSTNKGCGSRGSSSGSCFVLPLCESFAPRQVQQQQQRHFCSATSGGRGASAVAARARACLNFNSNWGCNSRMPANN